MARQKSDNRILPQGRGNPAPTRPRKGGGGKAITVKEEARQPSLFPDSAEKPARAGVVGEAVRHRRQTAPFAARKVGSKGGRVEPATIESVNERLLEAFENVARNRGAPGPDGRTLDDVAKHLDRLLPKVQAALTDGSYAPGEIRRKWIPKPGGLRGLGIPNVIDRMVQEAVRLVLEPLYEPTFHNGSHGFRPNRSCHTAIAAAVEHVDEGYEWVVDIDLEKFFDKVHHQRLMARLAERVEDKRLLALIGRMLKAKVVMPDGLVEANEEGVPQGGPLSPLLSNIVLDELDWELARRGHRFVRYADDANIYVRSERAGLRVMASVRKFIERRLRLKVNESKSAVARPEERHFLGFRLKRGPMNGTVQVLLSERSMKRINARIRELTPRNLGRSLDGCIKRLNGYLNGWIGFFGICTGGVVWTLRGLDSHIRRRLRAAQLKQWKRKKTIARRLIQFGIRPKTAWRCVYDGRKSIWALSHANAVDRALSNSFWDARGLVSLHGSWKRMQTKLVVPEQQLKLFPG